MSIFSKLFSKKQNDAEENVRVGGMEDFMTLIRVYYQAVMATNIGISNINFLPDIDFGLYLKKDIRGCSERNINVNKVE